MTMISGFLLGGGPTVIGPIYATLSKTIHIHIYIQIIDNSFISFKTKNDSSLLTITFSLLPSTFSFLPPATFSLPPTTFSLPPTTFSLPPAFFSFSWAFFSLLASTKPNNISLLMITFILFISISFRVSLNTITLKCISNHTTSTICTF